MVAVTLACWSFKRCTVQSLRAGEISAISEVRYLFSWFSTFASVHQPRHGFSLPTDPEHQHKCLSKSHSLHSISKVPLIPWEIGPACPQNGKVLAGSSIQPLALLICTSFCTHWWAWKAPQSPLPRCPSLCWADRRISRGWFLWGGELECKMSSPQSPTGSTSFRNTSLSTGAGLLSLSTLWHDPISRHLRRRKKQQNWKLLFLNSALGSLQHSSFLPVIQCSFEN